MNISWYLFHLTRAYGILINHIVTKRTTIGVDLNCHWKSLLKDTFSVFLYYTIKSDVYLFPGSFFGIYIFSSSFSRIRFNIIKFHKEISNLFFFLSLPLVLSISLSLPLSLSTLGMDRISNWQDIRLIRKTLKYFMILIIYEEKKYKFRARINNRPCTFALIIMCYLPKVLSDTTINKGI